MKKVYSCPSVSTSKIRIRATLLAGSNTSLGKGDKDDKPGVDPGTGKIEADARTRAVSAIMKL